MEEARRQFAGRSPLPPILVAWSEAWHKGVVGIAAGRIAKELQPSGGAAGRRGGRGHRLGAQHAGARAARLPGRLEGAHGTFRRPLAGGGADGGDRPSGGAAERVGGGGRGVARGAAGPAASSTSCTWRRAEVSNGLLAQLARLEPFGQGNPRPLVRTGPLRLRGRAAAVRQRPSVGARARGEDGAAVELVGWRWGERAGSLRGRFEVLACVENDSYRGGPGAAPASTAGPRSLNEIAANP